MIQANGAINIQYSLPTFQRAHYVQSCYYEYGLMHKTNDVTGNSCRQHVLPGVGL